MSDVDMLIQAIERVQIKLKENSKELKNIEDKIDDGLKGFINANLQNHKDFDLFKDMLVIPELMYESLALKKFNLVGCKMKIY